MDWLDSPFALVDAGTVLSGDLDAKSPTGRPCFGGVDCGHHPLNTVLTPTVCSTPRSAPPSPRARARARARARHRFPAAHSFLSFLPAGNLSNRFNIDPSTFANCPKSSGCSGSAAVRNTFGDGPAVTSPSAPASQGR